MLGSYALCTYVPCFYRRTLSESGGLAFGRVDWSLDSLYYRFTIPQYLLCLPNFWFVVLASIECMIPFFFLRFHTIRNAQSTHFKDEKVSNDCDLINVPYLLIN